MSVNRKNVSELKSFGDQKFNPVGVYASGQMKVIAAFFRPGQFIPVHTPGVDVVFYIIEGSAELVAGDQRLTVGPGELIVVPRGEKRGIRALSELTALHIVQPVPSEADHAEVHQKLSQGRFE